MIKFLIICTIIINIIGYILMGYDKHLAINKKYRISENTLFLIAFFLGSIGIYLGMYIFRHKTKHLSFKFLIPICFLINIFFIYSLILYFS